VFDRLRAHFWEAFHFAILLWFLLRLTVVIKTLFPNEFPVATQRCQQTQQPQINEIGYFAAVVAAMNEVVARHHLLARGKTSMACGRNETCRSDHPDLLLSNA
jgi:hypothetical protein